MKITKKNLFSLEIKPETMDEVLSLGEKIATLGKRVRLVHAASSETDFPTYKVSKKLFLRLN